MNILSTIPLQQMFCLIYIHCLTFDLSFEGIHRRECQYLSTCCASICLCSARITTNYISFVKIWMTESFIRLHIHGMIRCSLLVLEELFNPYLDMQTRNSCQIWIWVSSISTEIFYQKSFLDAFSSSISLVLLIFLDRENEAGRFIPKTSTRKTTLVLIKMVQDNNCAT